MERLFIFNLVKSLRIPESDFLYVNFEDYEVRGVDPLLIIPAHVEIYKVEPNIFSWMKFKF